MPDRAHRPASPHASQVEPTDAELMERTARGDRDAFAVLYRKHQGTIFRFARLMTGRETDAEDIVQEVFLVVMRDPQRFEPERASLSTYLYGIARRQTRRRLLRDRRFIALDGAGHGIEPCAAGDADSELSRRSELLELRRAILTLPSRHREVIVLCDLQEVTYAEAAATIGCPLGTVRSRLSRARRLLLERLQRVRRTTTGTDGAPTGRASLSARMRCAV
jgi:RNA polymerase sigma-70 factor (ECF subfamily)